MFLRNLPCRRVEPTRLAIWISDRTSRASNRTSWTSKTTANGKSDRQASSGCPEMEHESGRKLSLAGCLFWQVVGTLHIPGQVE